MRLRTVVSLLLACGFHGVPEAASAQELPGPLIEVVVGSSSYVDDATDHFKTFGAGARWFVTPRIALGPEIVMQRGDHDATNLTVTGNVTFDFVRGQPGRRFVPYAAFGGGYLRQTTIVGSGPGSDVLRPFTSSEGTLSGGIGARVTLGKGAYVAPEFRLGYEPEWRITVMIGFQPGR